MATGVLVVAIGEATKLVPWLASQDKVYEATIALGIETDTLDADGHEVHRAPVSDGLRAALGAYRRGAAIAPMLQAALTAEGARTTQVPPAFSAIKQNGERSYLRARRGERSELTARTVRVRRLELLATCEQPPQLAVMLDVGKGYYVRALARDLADSLGTVGHLTSLRRTRSGSFASDEALALELSADELLAHIQPLSRVAARALPVAGLTDAGARDARHGRLVHPSDIDAKSMGVCAWLDPRGELVAVGDIDEAGCGKVLRGFTSSLD
jgi:tRNA pseudouridine55 synthase